MEANSKLFSKILLYHYSFFQCYMGNKSGSDLNFAKWETHGFWWWWLGTNWHIQAALQPCVRFLLCSTFVKKRENLGSMVISWLSLRIFPAFFAFNRKWATKTRVQVLLAMLCAFYEKNMGLSLLPHLLHTFTPNWTKPSVLWWWSLQRREAFLPPSSTLK